MANLTLYELARALYEGLPTLSNLAESMARQYGKAGSLSWFEKMGDDVKFFWCDIARQIINHSKEWEENKGCACCLSSREQSRLQTARLAFKEAAKTANQQTLPAAPGVPGLAQGHIGNVE